jgi:hypothetical protein
LVILFFCARCFTRIYDLRTGAMEEIRGAQRLQQWRRRQKQWTGKQWFSPTLPLYSFLVTERGLRRGARSRNGSPLTGREIVKLLRCPWGSQNPDPSPRILRFYDPTTSCRSKSHYESQSRRIHVESRSKS